MTKYLFIGLLVLQQKQALCNVRFPFVPNQNKLFRNSPLQLKPDNPILFGAFYPFALGQMKPYRKTRRNDFSYFGFGGGFMYADNRDIINWSQLHAGGKSVSPFDNANYVNVEMGTVENRVNIGGSVSIIGNRDLFYEKFNGNIGYAIIHSKGFALTTGLNLGYMSVRVDDYNHTSPHAYYYDKDVFYAGMSLKAFFVPRKSSIYFALEAGLDYNYSDFRWWYGYTAGSGKHKYFVGNPVMGLPNIAREMYFINLTFGAKE